MTADENKTVKKVRKHPFTFDLTEYSENQWKQADNDMKEDLKEWIKATSYEQLPIQPQLNKSAEEVTESFFEKFNRWPSSTSLYYLSNYCLLRTIKNKKKSKHDEDSFLSPSQLHRRDMKESAVLPELIDLNHQRIVNNPAKRRITQEVKEETAWIAD